MIPPEELSRYLRFFMPETNRTFGSTSQIIDTLLREARMEMDRTCKPGRAFIYIPTIAGQREYGLPIDIMEVLAAFYDDVELECVTMEELDALDLYWTQVQGTPRAFYMGRYDNRYKVEAIGAGRDTYRYIGLYPKPDTSGSTAGMATFSQETGAVARVTEDGVDATFNQETGVIADMGDGTYLWTGTEPYGEVAAIMGTGAGILRLHVDYWTSLTLEPNLDATSQIYPIWMPDFVDRLLLDYVLWKLHEIRKAAVEKESQGIHAQMAAHHEAVWKQGLETWKDMCVRRTQDNLKGLRPYEYQSVSRANVRLPNNYPNPWRSR